MKEMKKYERMLLGIGKFLAVSFIFLFLAYNINVYAHEYGHYIAASYFGLEPEIYFSDYPNDVTSVSKFPEGAITYLNPNNNIKLALIALAGPLINLSFLLIGFYIFFKTPQNSVYEYISILFIITAGLAFLANIWPYGHTDGMQIIEALSNV